MRSGLVVDLGCGPGRWAARLRRAGYDVLGVDVSPAMLRLARRNCPGGRFARGSLHSARLPACDAITAIGEGVAYGPGDLRRFCRRAARALRPGGVLIFDLRLPERAGARGRSWKARSSGPGFSIDLEKTQRGRLLTRRILLERRSAGRTRRSLETHRLRLYTAAETLAALRAAGLRPRRLRAYGRQPLTGTLAGFLAVKPKARA